jgi:hypothetical protein
MSATLKLTHKAIGAEVRRGTLDVVVDRERVGSLEMNDTVEIPIEAGHHSMQVRNGRNLSRSLTFDAAEGQIVGPVAQDGPEWGQQPNTNLFAISEISATTLCQTSVKVRCRLPKLLVR